MLLIIPPATPAPSDEIAPAILTLPSVDLVPTNPPVVAPLEESPPVDPMLTPFAPLRFTRPPLPLRPAEVINPFAFTTPLLRTEIFPPDPPDASNVESAPNSISAPTTEIVPPRVVPVALTSPSTEISPPGAPAKLTVPPRPEDPFALMFAPALTFSS